MPNPLQRDPSTGKLPRDSRSGRLLSANADGSCCCACAGCAGRSVGHFSCTLAGVALLQGCSNAGSFLDWVHVDQASLSGTFTLTRRDDPPAGEPPADPFGVLPARCVWTYDETLGVTVSAQAYRDPFGNCTTAKTGDFGFHIRLSRLQTGGGPGGDTGRYTLEAWLGNADEIFHDLFLARLDTADCASPADFAALPPAQYHQPKGSGGTATLTPAS